MIVLGVSTDPDPIDPVGFIINTENPIVLADTNRPQGFDSFEVKRWMPGIYLE